MDTKILYSWGKCSNVNNMLQLLAFVDFSVYIKVNVSVQVLDPLDAF